MERIIRKPPLIPTSNNRKWTNLSRQGQNGTCQFLFTHIYKNQHNKIPLQTRLTLGSASLMENADGI
jgi:pantothenate kinase